MPRLGSYERWPDSAVEYALKAFPEYYRRTVLMAVYTGQRQGDCLSMTWAQYDGAGLEVVQQKTGARLWVPAHTALKKELDAWKKTATATTILTGAHGRPWVTRSFSVQFSAEMRRHPKLHGLVFHGLRKAAAARLAEAGCSTLEIMSITGHASLAEVERYTRQAEQKSRAQAAIYKLEQHRK